MSRNLNFFKRMIQIYKKISEIGEEIIKNVQIVERNNI